MDSTSNSYDFFEGAEKRVVVKSSINLIKMYKVNEWKTFLSNVGCNVLNVISNNNIIMFLLSESTFIVTPNYLILKTCGVTTPLNLIAYLNKQGIKIDDIEYSHPNFIKPDLQNEIYKSFGIEVKYIEEQLEEINFISMKVLHMYYLYSNPITNNNEITLWDFQWTNDVIIMLHSELQSWKIDDYVFKPHGYSMNAMDDKNNYITIHVTPNTSCSYLSFETNNSDLLYLAKLIIEKTNPKKIGFFSNNNKFEIEIPLEFRHKIYNNGNVYIKYYS